MSNRKHTARHRREHVCHQPGCARAQGFATVNDLERHQKTVHGVEPSHGQSRMYKCFSTNCKQWEKEWPRMDNFKQHLIRMHKSESTEDLIRQSNEWYEAEKKSRQHASIPAGEILSPDLEAFTSSHDQASEAFAGRQQFRSHLSPNWVPIPNAVRAQQASTSSRPRHSSISSQPNLSVPASPSRVPSFKRLQSPGIDFGGNSEPGQPSVNAMPSQLSPEFLIPNSYPLPRRRLTSAYTMPNPDTSALSDLPDMSLPSYSGVFPAAQNDLAQIASNFSSEQQLILPSSDPDFHSSSSPPNTARRSSAPFSFSIEAIEALIDRNGDENKRERAAFLRRIMEAGFEKIGEKQHRSAATTTSPPPSNVSSSPSLHLDPSDTRLPYRCSEGRCTKTYPRRCDLTKHLKRHHRPYGCTFSKCDERFGSKYDWKRHENSQHFQPECWKCCLCSNSTARNGRGPTSSYPAQLFYRRNLYVAHLQGVHSASSDTVREHVHKQRLGRNCQTTFWCGFCGKIIALLKKGLDGADERFNHIDEHFKKGLDISKWVDMDGSVVKGQPLESNQEEREENMNDVLGEDGIGSGAIKGGEQDDEGLHEDASYAVDAHVDAGGGGAVTGSSIGQKRAFPSDLGTASSSAEARPAHRRRPDSAQGEPPPVAFVCCECGYGPLTLKHDEHCVMCTHRCCGMCTYTDRKGEVVRR